MSDSPRQAVNLNWMKTEPHRGSGESAEDFARRLLDRGERDEAPAAMSDLAAFLTARLAEDETAAKAASQFKRWHVEPWYSDPAEHKRADVWGNTGAQITGNGALDVEDAEHIARHDPARVLREAEAKRKIIALATLEVVDGREVDYDVREVMDLTLQTLAAVYADHPDFDPQWK